MRPINYDGKGHVMAYHPVVNPDGSTTEHTAMVALNSIPNATRMDGTTDPNTLVLTCPICGTRSWVPLLGGREAQRFHAQVYAARNGVAYNDTATNQIISNVKAAGGQPAIAPNDNPMGGRP